MYVLSARGFSRAGVQFFQPLLASIPFGGDPAKPSEKRKAKQKESSNPKPETTQSLKGQGLLGPKP